MENIKGDCAALANLVASQPINFDAGMIELDGTANKGRLGANAILAVSMATARAARGSLDDCRSTATWVVMARAAADADDERNQWRRACG